MDKRKSFAVGPILRRLSMLILPLLYLHLTFTEAAISPKNQDHSPLSNLFQLEASGEVEQMFQSQESLEPRKFLQNDFDFALSDDSSSSSSSIVLTTRNEITATSPSDISSSSPKTELVTSMTPKLSSTSTTSPHPSMPVPDKLQRVNNTGTIALRGKCNSTDQCSGDHTECRLSMCKCELGYLPRIDNANLCGEASAHHVEVPTTDPTMIGVIIGLVLMSVTLCVVMRLFAKARFQENRTIFNTPNPRLMNVSLLKGGSKSLMRGNSGGRRGSHVSVNSEGGGGAREEAAAPTAPARKSKPKPHRQLSTDTTNTESTPSSRPISSVNKAKFRQDSVASNSNV